MRTSLQFWIVLTCCGLSAGVLKSGNAGEGIGALFGRKEGKSVEWLVSETEVVTKARQTTRPILMYVTSRHCTFCRKMERETWSHPQVVAAIESGFIPFRVTPDTHPELVEGLHIQGFPTTIVVSPGDPVVARLQGYVPHDRLLSIFDDVQKARVASQTGKQTVSPNLPFIENGLTGRTDFQSVRLLGRRMLARIGNPCYGDPSIQPR